MKKLTSLILFFTICCFTTNAQVANVLGFNGTNLPYGNTPYGDLLFDGTFFYGMTFMGGTSDKGVIFKVKPDGSAYDTLMNFNLTNGRFPHGSLISDGIFLYGMTAGGGASDYGSIFKIKKDGTGYMDLHDFSPGTDGNSPLGSLISDGTFLYGMTQSGGAGAGIIFKIKMDGTNYSHLYDFPYTATVGGASPLGSLIFDGTFLYGTAPMGGTGFCSGGCGIIFKIKTDGTGYTDIYNAPAPANSPASSLISDGTYLYGTGSNGTHGYGFIYKIKPDGTGYSVLYNFTAAPDGNYAHSALAFDGTFLYGMTRSGGTANEGTIYKLKPDGTGYSKLTDLNGYPEGSLLFSGAYLFGMTASSGTHGKGRIFSYEYLPLCTGFYTTTYDSTLNNFTLTVHDTAVSDPTTGYSWNFGDGTTSTLPNPSHVYTTNGVYNVCMTKYRATGDSCIYCHLIGIDSAGNIIRTPGFTINVYNPNVSTGLTEQLKNEIKISVYPNPFSSQTVLQTNKNLGNATLTIYNSLGQQVKQIKNIYGQTVTIQRDNLRSGVYFLRLTEGNKLLTTDKLIITAD